MAAADVLTCPLLSGVFELSGMLHANRPSQYMSRALPNVAVRPPRPPETSRLGRILFPENQENQNAELI